LSSVDLPEPDGTHHRHVLAGSDAEVEMAQACTSLSPRRKTRSIPESSISAMLINYLPAAAGRLSTE
jgi:hypothetical protein